MEQNEHHRESQHPSEYSIYLRAADELESSKEEIKRRWEERVREEVTSAAGQSSLAIRNTLGIFLGELTEVLRHSSDGEVAHEGMSTFHGGQRAKFSGYFLPQLLKEFSLLREVINELLHAKGVLSYEVRSLIDKAVDSVISAAAAEFALVQHAKTSAALLKSETSNVDLERFAAVAAHDLKSPLSTITSYLNLLDSEFANRLGEEGIQFVRVMLGASQRMRNLVDSLLDYARLTNTKSPFQMVNLDAVVKGALQNLEDEIAQAGAKVSAAGLPTVFGNADLLSQLFQNLVANAIKFRGKRIPEIRITCEARNGDWVFAVKDNGIGFDPKHANEIFGLYKKLHGEAEYRGSGIGLASAKKVVELHGGKIWAESQPGVGSTFSFTLPKPQTNDVVVH